MQVACNAPCATAGVQLRQAGAGRRSSSCMVGLDCASERTSGAAHDIGLVCLEPRLAHKLQVGRAGRAGRARSASHSGTPGKRHAPAQHRPAGLPAAQGGWQAGTPAALRPTWQFAGMWFTSPTKFITKGDTGALASSCSSSSGSSGRQAKTSDLSWCGVTDPPAPGGYQSPATSH